MYHQRASASLQMGKCSGSALENRSHRGAHRMEAAVEYAARLAALKFHIAGVAHSCV